VFLPDLFALSLAGRRDSPALDYDAPDGSVRTLTFGELDRRSDSLAAVLSARGCDSGDRLALYLANRVEFIELFLACLKLGVIVVPMNVLYRERELAHIIADAEPRAVVTSPEQAIALPSAASRWMIEELTSEARRTTMTPPLGRRPGDDAAAIVYTSGTTGRSKGAVLTHHNFAANAANLITCWSITSADRYLGVLPLFHVHGLGNGVCAWLASGCRMRLLERFDAAKAPAVFESFAPTVLFAVPTIYVRMLEWPEDVAQRVGGTMRLFVSGSAPLPAHVHEAFRHRFGHTILERYGMSETLMNTGNPYAGERRAGSVGIPFPGVSLRIQDATGRVVDDEIVGELYVRGPNVSPGYWRNDEATAAAYHDGWFRTGDLAERSRDGYYTLRGRTGDLIISGGFNIYPREVEEVLLELPGVREAVVVAGDDPARGEIPVAYVVADDPFDARALDSACRQALASFKCPRAFVRVNQLPRTALGKVQRHLLPEWRAS
jgi:malonyl-CoA/methylmalonyl-CoA synthetase